MFWCFSASANSLYSLRFTHLDAEDGLPSSAIFVSYQDSRGYMWFGTQNGLGRFDGRHSVNFTSRPEVANSLSHNLVLALLEDAQGDMWIGTRGGLDRLDRQRDTIERLTMPAHLSVQERRVVGLVPGQDGSIWVGSEGGLFRLTVATRQLVPWQARGLALPAGVPGSAVAAVTALISDRHDGIWAAFGARVAHISAQGVVDHVLHTGQGWQAGTLLPLELRVASLALDQQGQLWVGTGGGLQLWQIGAGGPTPQPLPAALALPHAPIVCMVPDEAQTLWIGVGNGSGLWRWQGQAGRLEGFAHNPAERASISAGSVMSLLIDRNRGLWVGTTGSTVSHVDLQQQNHTAYLAVAGDEQSLAHPSVMAILPDGQDAVWVGTYGGGMNRVHLSSGNVKRLTDAALPLTHVKALLDGHGNQKGNIWAGGDGGLYLFDPVHEHSQKIALGNDTIKGASISALLQSRHGDVWAASAAGLYRIDPSLAVQVFRAHPHQPGALGHDVIDALLEDRDGHLWVGSKGGLYRWQAGRFVPGVVPNADAPAPEKLAIHGLRQDRHGRIWMATTAGLFELIRRGEQYELQSWRKAQGMPQTEFDSIQDGEQGEIWLGNEFGLTRFDPVSQSARYYPGPSQFGGGFNFGAAGRGPDGSVYFGGNGLIRLQPQTRPLPVLEVVLSDVLLFNRSLLSPQDANWHQVAEQDGAARTAARVGVRGPLYNTHAITLSYEDAMVSFELSALHFYHRNLLRYAWKLDGLDANWIVGQGAQGMATYTNLNPGHYRLLAKVANPDGVWSEPSTLLEVTVLPPFWRTWWWYGGTLLLMVLALLAIYRWRVRHLRANQSYLEQEVKARTHEAVGEREAAEKARRDIALLSEIGRQITASLDVQAIQQTLYQHVRELLNADVFGAGLVDWQQRVIQFDYVMVDDQPLQPYRRSLAATEQPAVQCALNARELMIDDLTIDMREIDQYERAISGQTHTRLEQGELPKQPHAALYVPMLLKGQVIGIICVLSERAHAFAAADLDKLRTLSAYAAVAIDNANAYQRLQTTQARLVEQEKLAALGSLVTGVAHELNTPIGNGMLIASTLNDMSAAFLQDLHNGQLRRSALEAFCNNAQTSSRLLMLNLARSANLITSFKQIAVDPGDSQRECFDLVQVCEEVVLTLANQIQSAGHQMQVNIAKGLMLDSYPGPFGQVLTHLINNALVHGLQGSAGGCMQLAAQQQGVGQVLITFRDNGQGIQAEHLARVFEPFFTTSLGQGSNGLGLYICYNIVGRILGGSIRVQNDPDGGARIDIVLPLVAPPIKRRSTDLQGEAGTRV